MAEKSIRAHRKKRQNLFFLFATIALESEGKDETMKLITAEKNGNLIARITGDIDHHSAPGIREEIDRAVREKKPQNLILDLEETDFMDSSGLGLILGRKRKTEEEGCGFVLLNPPKQVLRILKFAGVDHLMEIQYVKGNDDEGNSEFSENSLFGAK
jgi:stage II sporulation protein AA (anti-sigma F factor antagonist)